MDIAAIANGDVGSYSMWIVMKLLAAADMDVAIDVFPADGRAERSASSRRARDGDPWADADDLIGPTAA